MTSRSSILYPWVKTALQTDGLVAPRAQRGRHHQRRPRRPLRGMMLYVDGSHFFHTSKAGGTMDNRYIREKFLPWH